MGCNCGANFVDINKDKQNKRDKRDKRDKQDKQDKKNKNNKDKKDKKKINHTPNKDLFEKLFG